MIKYIINHELRFAEVYNIIITIIHVIYDLYMEILSQK